MNTPNAPSIPNVMKYEDVLKRAEECGADAARGGDSQMRFHMTCIEAAYQGAIDLDANKHGQGVDDARKLAEAYVKKAGGMFVAKDMKAQKLTSTLRLDIKLGMWPKGGPGEPLTVVNKLVSKWQELGRNAGTRKLRQDATNAVHKFARKQLKLDSVIADSELEAFCFKPGQEPQTVEDVLVNTRKTLQRLYDGKAGGKTLECKTDNVKEAIGKITKQLAEIAKAKNPSAVQNTK